MAETNTILTIPQPGVVELREKPYPKIAPGYVVVKVAVAPICIEHQCYKDHLFEVFEDAENLGHEGVGEVVEVGPGSKFKVGDRVIVYPHHGCDGQECFVCRTGLSPAHCMQNPLEELEAFSDPDAPMDVLGGDKAMYMPGFSKYMERVCDSESGGFGFARYRIAPERQIQTIPDDLDFRHAALAMCSCGCTYTAAEETGVKAGDWVLVAGIGFIGLGAIINAKYRGANVIALGRNETRMELARKMGADHVVNPDDPDWLEQVRALTGEYKGCDVVFEGSGYPYYQRRALQAVRRYGSVFLLGFLPDNEEPFPIDLLNEVMNRHIKITGGHDEAIRDRDGIVRMLNTPWVKEKLDVLITHEYNMSEAAEAFEICLSKKSGKVLLYPQDDCPKSGPTTA